MNIQLFHEYTIISESQTYISRIAFSSIVIHGILFLQIVFNGCKVIFCTILINIVDFEVQRAG